MLPGTRTPPPLSLLAPLLSRQYARGLNDIANQVFVDFSEILQKVRLTHTYPQQLLLSYVKLSEPNLQDNVSWLILIDIDLGYLSEC